MTINVEKRDGSIEPLNLEKIHKMVEEATEGLSGVSASQVEMHSNIQFMTASLQKTSKRSLIRSASVI